MVLSVLDARLFTLVYGLRVLVQALQESPYSAL